MKNTRDFVALVAALIMFAIGGCASMEHAVSTGPHVQCLVCKHNADLACVDIPFNDDTKRTVYNGQTYYFCSDECQQKFIKEPFKYISINP